MTEQKRPGRPRSDSKLTPAEKQAAYRLRRGAQEAALQSQADFKKSFEYQINYEIAQAIKRYQDAPEECVRLVNFHHAECLKRFKMIMDQKSNVTETKTWLQDELF